MVNFDESVRKVIDSWSLKEPSASLRGLAIGLGEAPWNARTDFSATVFSGEGADWVRYLGTPMSARYEPDLGVRVHVQAALRLVAFEAENEDSRWLADLLDKTLGWLRQQVKQKPNVLALLEELLFSDSAQAETGARIVLSPGVPSTGTREVTSDLRRGSDDTRFVLHSRLVRDLRDVLAVGAGLSVDEKLGVAWPVVSRLLSQLGYPFSPRDRFVAKIDAFAKLTYLAINVLYEESRSGRLVANGAGAAFELLCSKSSNVARAQLFEQHPYFRTLSRLSFLLRARPYATYAEEARIVAREYLDTVYLRLNLAGAMPDLAEATRPMAFESKKGKIKTPRPRVGRYGIGDDEDLGAWKKVAHPCRDLGFILLRQIGVGDFGRVYEVLNRHNPEFPARLALKIDRIIGRKKQAILEAEAARRVGAELARVPHLVRLYDTGKLSGQRFTYHVLQLIDGDTIDSLIQARGVEHASNAAPLSAHTGAASAREEYERAVRMSANQAGRRPSRGLPFRYPLTGAMVLDVLTSVLLAVEETHQAGYALNDLKNDNLMISRRGQVKGIDLDSFSPVSNHYDKITDFMFLAAAVILLVFNAPSTHPGQRLQWKQLAESEERLRGELTLAWPFGDVEGLSEQRCSKQELTDLLVDLVQRCHGLLYAERPDVFSADIARLIGFKRRLLAEEFVID